MSHRLLPLPQALDPLFVATEAVEGAVPDGLVADVQSVLAQVAMDVREQEQADAELRQGRPSAFDGPAVLPYSSPQR